ncbi:P-loop containing nucleoside triphosphate hydrolase protein, partial [Mycena galopus ATCC 62051]
PLNWGDVLEIQGPSGSGKTQLVQSLLAIALMPCSFGWGKAAVVFDTEGTFDLGNFRRVLVRASSRYNTSSDEAQLLVETALRNLHVFRPASTAQLAASIYNLPAYQKAHMPDADIALVAVDSLSAFYWPDRFTAEQLRRVVPNSAATALQHVLTSLQKFRLSHNSVTVLTNWALTLADNSGGPPPNFYKQHLPSFPSFPHSAAANAAVLPLTHHITLYLAPIPPFHGIGSSLPRPHDADMVTGYIRRPGTSQVGRFILELR